MRLPASMLGVLGAILLGGCDFWPRELDTLAESIGRQSAGEVNAWLLGGDFVVIDVARSPLSRQPRTALAAVAADFAGQAVAAVPAPLESVVVTFQLDGIGDAENPQQEFLFLLIDGRPVLQTLPDADAAGPLGASEIRAAADRLGDGVSAEQRRCLLDEAQDRADRLGDPELATVEKLEAVASLPAGTLRVLDPVSRRLLLAQAVASEALFHCLHPGAAAD